MKKVKKDFKKKVMQNPIVNFVYNNKYYFDLGIGQIGWFSGKLPELMAITWFFERAGVYLSNFEVVLYGSLAGLIITTFGYTWYILGLFHAERHVDNRKDPIMSEVYEAAKKINRRFK